MTPADFLRQSQRMLTSAHGVIQDFRRAFVNQDWPLSVRRAQEASELLVKAAILSHGVQYNWGHGGSGKKPGDGPVEQLRALSKSKTELLHTVKREENVPVFFVCTFADDKTQGHAILLCKNTLTLQKVYNVTYDTHDRVNCCGRGDNIWEVEVEWITESPIKLIRHTLQKEFIVVTQGTRVIAAFNEHGGEQFANSSEFTGVQIRDSAWDAMLDAADALQKDRDPAFYHEKPYLKADAKAAGERMKLIYTLTKMLLGGPQLAWEPLEP